MRSRGLSFLAAYVTVLVLGVGYANDAASCARHNVLVPQVRAESRYAIDAATAREKSAHHEAARDPAQARIDLTAAAAFRRDAASIKTKTLDCSFPLPATR